MSRGVEFRGDEGVFRTQLALWLAGLAAAGTAATAYAVHRRHAHEHAEYDRLFKGRNPMAVLEGNCKDVPQEVSRFARELVAASFLHSGGTFLPEMKARSSMPLIFEEHSTQTIHSLAAAEVLTMTYIGDDPVIAPAQWLRTTIMRANQESLPELRATMAQMDIQLERPPQAAA
jgi:hypothetical protein